nr:MAG TPA: hypothetical protein [Caudoviricetes sp.]
MSKNFLFLSGLVRFVTRQAFLFHKTSLFLRHTNFKAIFLCSTKNMKSV